MSDQFNDPQTDSSGARPPRRLAATRLGADTGPGHPQFSQPVRQILLMVAVLVVVLWGGWLTYGRVLSIFQASPWLNGLILAVFAIGVLACFGQVAQLVNSVSWIERFAERRRNAVGKGISAVGEGDAAPRLLAPLAALLGTRGPIGGAISAVSARSILESVSTRIDEIRDITKYISNLLIFLGLLGTFYGLATTVPAVVETIRALAPQQGETGADIFDKLLAGLEGQLGGMATAFSSSLLGLAGSLVVGLLELFVTHGQNRFYRELEEWISGFTRLSLSSSDSGSIDPAAYGGALEQIATQMDALQHLIADREVVQNENALMTDERVLAITNAVDALTRHAESERELSVNRAERLIDALARLADSQDRMLKFSATQPANATDQAGIEAAIANLATRLNDSREMMLADIRGDLLVLTRAVRAAHFSDPYQEGQNHDEDQKITAPAGPGRPEDG